MMMLTPQEVHRADVAHSQALLKIEQLETENTRLLARVRELEARLAEYGAHKTYCKGITYWGLNQTESRFEGPCSCGLAPPPPPADDNHSVRREPGAQEIK